MNHPKINVTPLIDVLLVLLIIFMVISPERPSRFEARIPAEPDRTLNLPPNPDTLQVSVGEDSSLRINTIGGFGNVDDPQKMIESLSGVFREREAAVERENVPDGAAERTVFIRAPRKASYGSVARVVDAVKTSGARPISLLIDDLN